MERITKPEGEYEFVTCMYGSRRVPDCDTVQKYNKAYVRLREYEDLGMTPKDIKLMRELLDRYEAIGSTPEEITYMLDHPKVETKIESIEVDVDDSCFKNALIKAFNAGMDVMTCTDDEAR